MPPRPPNSPLASNSRNNSFNYDESTLTGRNPTNDKYDSNEHQTSSTISYGGAGSFIPPSPSSESRIRSSSPNQHQHNPINRNSFSSIPPYELEKINSNSHSYSYPPNSSSYQRVGQVEDHEVQDQANPHRHVTLDRQQAESLKWDKLMRDAGVDKGKGRDRDGHDDQFGDKDGFWDRVERNTTSNFIRSIIHFTRNSPYLMTFLTMIPIVTILWIPGLVALLIYHSSSKNGFSNPSVWSVGLLWWSIWLSTVYLGWYICWLVASLGPNFLRMTVGKMSSDLKHYIAYLAAIQKYLAFFLWTLLVWLTWLMIVWNNFKDPAKYLIDGDQINPLLGSSNSTSSSDDGNQTTLAQTGTDSLAIHMVTIGRFWLGLFFSSTLLLGEKIVIQAIAWKFHLVSYADRISTSKFHIEVLTTLYANSKPSNSGIEDLTISSEARNQSQQGPRSTKGSKLNLLERKRERRSRNGGNSILATSVEELLPKRKLDQLGLGLPKWDKNPLKPQDSSNDPRELVLDALDNSKDTKSLARRIFFSFATLPSFENGASHHHQSSNPNEKSGTDEPTAQQERIREDMNLSESPLRLTMKSISKCFPDYVTSETAFEMFDKDLNGDCTLEEMVEACQESRRERKVLSSSMRDVDSAVGNLDQLFQSVFLAIAIIIIAALVSVKFSTLIASFGSALLGLSWLLSSSAQETLSSALFLFVKHPYDIGDRVDIWYSGTLEGSFIVQELALLTTTFTTLTGEWTTMSHNILCTKTIVNARRSGPTIEPFNLEVAYSTSFHQIEQLRSKMSGWLNELPHRRHFLPGLDIKILSLGGTYNLSGRIGSGMNITNDQESMLLSLDIRYRSNLQSQELQNRRRNLWICQLKVFLSELQIFGVNGDPSSISISKSTSVPYPPTLKDLYGSANGPPDSKERVEATRGDGNRSYEFLDDENEKINGGGSGSVGRSPWTQTPNESWKPQAQVPTSHIGILTRDHAAYASANHPSGSGPSSVEMFQRGQRIWAGQNRI